MKRLQFRVLWFAVAVVVLALLCAVVGAQPPPPDTYLYIPRITFSPEEHRCLDCKTFAIVAIMRYYGDPVTFEDICREVGQPPGAVYADVAFFRRLIEFVGPRGFIVEDHYWRVDQILAQVEKGRPVIASHRFGDLPTEPGIVKGFSNSHLWVWGVQEYIQQRSKDSPYTHAEFQALLEKRDSGTGMMGYVPELFSKPANCLLIYKPDDNVAAPPYEIEAVSHSTRNQSSEEGGPGVVRVMSFAGEGEMRWSGQFNVAEDKEIEVRVYDDEYVIMSEQGPAVIFAVRFLPGSQDAGTVIQGYSNNEKSIWRSPLGHTFEKVSLPVTRLSNMWFGSIVIRPVMTVEQLVVEWPIACENRPFFGYEIRVEQ